MGINNTSTTYPTTKQSITNPVDSDYLNNPNHASQHSDANDTLGAIQDRLGLGSDTTPGAAGKVLLSISSTESKWATFVPEEIPTGDCDGINKEFTLANVPISNSFIAIYLNGQRIRQTPAYLSVSGAVITFVDAPTGEVSCDYYY